MGEKTSNRLASNLEQLVNRVENIQTQRTSELDQVSGVLGNMDKLVDVIHRIELQREAEQQLNGKLDILNDIIEKLNAQEATETRSINVEETLRKVIKGVKVTGKVMDIVAGSLGVMFDSISTTVKSTDRQGATRGAKDQVDLSSMLAPLGGLLQGLFGTNEQTDSSPGKSFKQEEKKEE